MSRRESSPRRKKEKKTLRSGIATSAVAVVIIMFALGRFPQVDAFFVNLNDNLREHNDGIVREIIRNIPVILLAIGGIGLLFMLFATLRGRRKTA